MNFLRGARQTAEILKDQDLHVEEALRLLTPDDIAELGNQKNKR